MGLKLIITDFASWTTCHGIPHVNSSRFWFLKLCWLLITLISTAGLVFMYNSVVLKFLTYPTNIQTSVKFDNIYFPQITFCNQNPLKLTAVNALPDPFVSNFLLLFYVGQTALSGNPVPAGYGLTNTTNELEILQSLRTNLGFFMYDMMSGNSSLLNETMYSLTDLLVTSSYQGSYLKNYLGGDGDYIQFTDATYGNCYSFNYNGSYTSSRAGPNFGYHAVYRTDKRDFLPLIEMTGIRLVVTEPQVQPIPSNFGINLNVGFSTAAIVSFTSNQRLGSPYGTCTNTGSGFTYLYNGTYFVDGCYRSCYQYAVIKKCSCYDPRYPTPPGITLPSCQKDWKSTPNTMFLCMNYMNTRVDGKLLFNPIADCNCPKLCADKTFSVTTSYALWPPKKHIPDECKNATSILQLYNARNLQQCVNWYSNNTVAVDVYYDKMNYLELVEYAAYPITSLINDMGGNLGLWLGGSVITLTEFLILLALCLVYLCARNKLKRDALKRVQILEKEH